MNNLQCACKLGDLFVSLALMQDYFVILVWLSYFPKNIFHVVLVSKNMATQVIFDFIGLKARLAHSWIGKPTNGFLGRCLVCFDRVI